jgi:hypothetical protein
MSHETPICLACHNLRDCLCGRKLQRHQKHWAYLQSYFTSKFMSDKTVANEQRLFPHLLVPRAVEAFALWCTTCSIAAVKEPSVQTPPANLPSSCAVAWAGCEQTLSWRITFSLSTARRFIQMTSFRCRSVVQHSVLLCGPGPQERGCSVHPKMVSTISPQTATSWTSFHRTVVCFHSSDAVIDVGMTCKCTFRHQ